mmetsp:Transcript_15842/g.25139  ORF Transcript_15842/g.25139 Transcript_15842/m.25139 type:complete len:163 (+) Transcript_15842:32-520(+)|eukprot:CAMPEP_0197072486 /NCGR_PEP_ID=MMETSP1384-20130603/210124_1 /TAXON_ID=29189 /ORGANISM="Ammonia sp." /LENGTH=162 /DNA_ID=CAMNT_0042511305 /DNA_START=28 /DNA_END=516 /DNA_ORIENTATION=-
MPKNKNRTRGKSKDELLQNKDSATTQPEVPSHLMSSLGDTSSSSKSVATTASKRKKGKKGSPELISLKAVQTNMHELHKIRVFTCIATGISAGILDLKGIYGFALFVIVFLISSLLMCVKMKMSLNKFFRPATKFLTTSLWDGLTSFVLFWTLFANILYLYG